MSHRKEQNIQSLSGPQPIVSGPEQREKLKWSKPRVRSICHHATSGKTPFPSESGFPLAGPS